MSDGVRLRTVALLARSAGLGVLENSLLHNPKVNLLAVATHRRLPRSEDPARGDRPEFPQFVTLCGRAGVRLIEADTRELAGDLSFIDDLGGVDVVASVSWRYMLSARALALPRLGAINLHRGKLPEFAGAEPVRRAIEAGRDTVTITAHMMVEEVDAGPSLAEVQLPTLWDGDTAPAIHAEVVKTRLLPLYPPLFDLALAACVARCHA